MKKAVCIETIFTEVPFEERFALAKQCGFDGVEFWTWKDKDIARIRKLCSISGIPIVAFSGDHGFSLVDPEEKTAYVAFVKDSLAVARELGCRYLVIHSNALDSRGNVLNRCDYVDNSKKVENAIEVLRELAPFAESAGVILALEALNDKVDHPGYFLCHTEDAVRIVQAVGSPSVKIVYDIYHMQIMEGNLINTLTRYIDYIGHIHIADVPGRHEPGTGEINFRNIVNTLKFLEYEGVIGFELFPLRSSSEAVGAMLAL